VKDVASALPTTILKLSKQRHEDRLKRLEKKGVDLEATVASTRLLNESLMRSMSACLPSALTVREFVENTTEESAHEAARRLSECEQCSERGGRCSSEARAGQKPKWTKDRSGYGSPGFEWVACDRWRIHQLDRAMKECGFPELLIPKGFSQFHPSDERDGKALKFCELYVENFYAQVDQGKGLGLFGGVGVGKTHLAVATARQILERHLVRTARFWDVSNLLANLRPVDGHEQGSRLIVADCMTCGLLVLDDLGSHKTTDWVREQVGMIVNHRWSNRLPMIVTSNYALERSADSIGERTVSRLKDATMYLRLSGSDRRIGKG
jgi:DNA replication protein DnaC